MTRFKKRAIIIVLWLVFLALVNMILFNVEGVGERLLYRNGCICDGIRKVECAFPIAWRHGRHL